MSEVRYHVDDAIRRVQVRADGDAFLVTVDETVYRVRARLGSDGRLQLEIDGELSVATIVQGKGCDFVHLDGVARTLPHAAPRTQRAAQPAEHQSGTVQAAMPGQVLDVLVTAGNRVEVGQTLLLMEAMKMELRITAPRAGRVVAVHCSPGHVVQRGQQLIDIADESADGKDLATEPGGPSAN